MTEESFFSYSPKEILHYREAGIKGQGETFLLLHGNPTSSYFYRHLLAYFGASHHLVAPDHLGSGLSSKQPGEKYTLAGHIQRLAAFVEAQELPPVTLVVHDWGGAIGMGWALDHPDRVKRLVILNTAAFPSKKIPWRIALLKTPWLGDQLIGHLNLFAWAATWMASLKPLAPEVKKAYLAPYDSWANRVGVRGFVKDIPMTKNHPTYALLEKIGARLSQGELTCPAAIAWGMGDFCFHGDFLKKWQEIFPDAPTLTLEGAGHYILEDEPLRVCRFIEEFLRETRP